jgi:hypothetical protein
MDQDRLAAAIRADRFEWRMHALARMAERGISQKDVLRVLCEGKIIEEYPQYGPYPAALFLGTDADNRPLHVVAALDSANDFAYVITAYLPEEKYFHPDWKTRRTS